MGRMRRMAAEFQGHFMDAMREAEFESVRKELVRAEPEGDVQHRRAEPVSDGSRASTPRR